MENFREIGTQKLAVILFAQRLELRLESLFFGFYFLFFIFQKFAPFYLFIYSFYFRKIVLVPFAQRLELGIEDLYMYLLFCKKKKIAPFYLFIYCFELGIEDLYMYLYTYMRVCERVYVCVYHIYMYA